MAAHRWAPAVLVHEGPSCVPNVHVRALMGALVVMLACLWAY